MKPLSLREVNILEQLKNRHSKRQIYIDASAKEVFDLLCHLEDFVIYYWNLEQALDEIEKHIEKNTCYYTTDSEITFFCISNEDEETFCKNLLQTIKKAKGE